MRAKNNVKLENFISERPERFPDGERHPVSGTELAKALIEHIARLGASGYSNELVVGGETWVIGINKGDSRWRTT